MHTRKTEEEEEEEKRKKWDEVKGGEGGNMGEHHRGTPYFLANVRICLSALLDLIRTDTMLSRHPRVVSFPWHYILRLLFQTLSSDLNKQPQDSLLILVMVLSVRIKCCTITNLSE